MLKKDTKHTGHTQLQLDYHYKTADFKKSKGEKNSFEKSQDSRRVLVSNVRLLLRPEQGFPLSLESIERTKPHFTEEHAHGLVRFPRTI